ncbi:MAG: hypothetical protein AAF483_04075 [Planctomycetota bacterium]
MLPNPTRYPIEGWQFTQCLAANTSKQSWLCHKEGMGLARAELLFPAEESDLIPFERKATLASLLPAGMTPRLLYSNLDHPTPLLVYEWQGEEPLEQVLSTRSKDWRAQHSMRFALRFFECLDSLHELGFVHGAVSYPSLLLDSQCCLKLSGFDRCVPTRTVLAHQTGAELLLSAPELRKRHSIADPAQDIFGATYVLSKLLGKEFLATDLAKAMTDQRPELRPSAGQILGLLLDLEQMLNNHGLAA